MKKIISWHDEKPFIAIQSMKGTSGLSKQAPKQPSLKFWTPPHEFWAGEPSALDVQTRLDDLKEAFGESKLRTDCAPGGSCAHFCPAGVHHCHIPVQAGIPVLAG